MLIKSLMVPTKSSLCSPLNSYSLCLCLPSVPKRRERKKPTSHALKEKLVGVFFFFWFFHHSFLAFSESQICDAWKMLLLCSNTNCYCIEKKQQPRVKTLFVCWVGLVGLPFIRRGWSGCLPRSSY